MLQKFPINVTKAPHVTEVPFFRDKSAGSFGSLSLSLPLSCTLLFYVTIFALLPFMQFLTVYLFLVLLFVILSLLLSLFWPMKLFLQLQSYCSLIQIIFNENDKVHWQKINEM